MSLWVDKYCPESLNDLDFHTAQAQDLKNMIEQGDFPHLLVHGPPGAGKHTRIKCILRQLYGNGVDKLKTETMHFETASKKKMEIMLTSSNYHIQVNPSDAGMHDRIVVGDLMKTVASTYQLDTHGRRGFKVVVMTSVDSLTTDAQHALRRTMEKYVSTCRLILSVNSTSRILPAIRSRCLPIRVPAPTVEEIKSILQAISKREGLELTDELATKLAVSSGRNLRRAILFLEDCKVKCYPFVKNQEINPLAWQSHIKKTGRLMVKPQTVHNLQTIRSRMYRLLTHGIPCHLIFRGLLREISKQYSPAVRNELAFLAAKYEHQTRLGSKAILHLEAFVTRFMAIVAPSDESEVSEDTI